MGCALGGQKPELALVWSVGFRIFYSLYLAIKRIKNNNFWWTFVSIGTACDYRLIRKQNKSSNGPDDIWKRMTMCACGLATWPTWLIHIGTWNHTHIHTNKKSYHVILEAASQHGAWTRYRSNQLRNVRSQICNYVQLMWKKTVNKINYNSMN